MKMIIKILGVVVLLVVVLVGVSIYYLDSGIKKAVETFGPDYTKTSVLLNDVSLSPLSGKGSLTGLAIGNPQGFSEANAFYLGQIAVAIDTQTLKSDPVIIRSLRIMSPEITYEQGKKGTNLQQLLKNIEQSTESTGSSDESSEGNNDEPKKIIIQDLQISGGKIHYINPLLGGKALNLDLPDIQLKGIGEKSNGATGAEVAEKIIAVITKTAGSTVAQSGVLKDAGKLVEDKLKTEKDKLERSLGEIKGLFDK